MSEIRPKHNDFFHFRYHPKNEWGFDGRLHCFEGLLRAYEVDGEIELRDTYWKLDPVRGDDIGRSFKLKEALKQGQLTFYCNLDDLEPIGDWERCYYDERDVYFLHSQNGCYQYHFKRKGAQKSKAAMLQEVQRRIDEARHDLERAQNAIERNLENQRKIESGDLTVTF